MEIEIMENKANLATINKTIDDAHELTKISNAECEALEELDSVLRKLVSVQASRKEKMKAVKRRMRYIDMNSEM